MEKCLLSLQRDPHKELVVCGELLHTKAKSKISGQQAATHTIVLFDVIYYQRDLVLQNQLERLDLLAELCRRPTTLEKGTFPGCTPRAYAVQQEGESNLWLAEVFANEFQYRFDECYEVSKDGSDKYPEIEGLMLRLRNSRWAPSRSGDVDWLLRCRKAKDKVYAF